MRRIVLAAALGLALVAGGPVAAAHSADNPQVVAAESGQRFERGIASQLFTLRRTKHEERNLAMLLQFPCANRAKRRRLHRHGARLHQPYDAIQVAGRRLLL